MIEQIWFLLLGGLAIAYGLDVWAGHDFPMVLALSIGGSFISYIYSAPPIKLKQNGWLGNYALGSSYISLPWWCGQAMFGELNIQASYHTYQYMQRYIFFACLCFRLRLPGGTAGGNSLDISRLATSSLCEDRAGGV